jgi:uncharacterized membrane protein
MTNPSELGLFFGRLPPLLVHLPIGLIVLLVFIEVLARFPRFKHANANSGVILALAVPVAGMSALCGWLLSSGGGYQEQLLQWHKWTGIGTACVCALAALLYWLDLKQSYRWCLFGSFLALVLASHFGGSLTHGSDYLVRYAPGPLRAWLGGGAPAAPAQPKPKDIAQLQVFAEIIQPVLQRDCVTCHGPEKLKGKLRLDSLEAMLKGGSSGPAILPGKAADSELVRRLKLPSDNEDHMPPEGKPQPAADEIALLQWWVDAGAPADKKLAELKPNASIKRILEARFGGPAPAAKVVQARPLNEVLPLAVELGAELHLALSPLSPTEPWLQGNASIAGTNFGDAQLARLTPLALNLRWLDLAGTGITDAGLAHLAPMRNLAKLHLERTAVTDAGLAALGELPELEYLNLYGTAITDTGLERLQDLPNLKRVFLWQTQVTPAAGQAFVRARTDTDQLQRWQQEIELLQAKIKDAHISVDLGTELAATPSTNAAPVNANCPVSGKPIDSTKTVLHEGMLVAFCCNDCRAKFQQDPKPFLAKLGPAPSKDTPTQPTK